MATILHVDDEPSVGLLLEDTLAGVGHRTLSAANVVEALQVLAREHVDLIISGNQMPGLTGLEFLSLLQHDARDVPLIILTGDASIGHAVAAIKAGAIDYITMPATAEQLERAVEQALDVARLRRESQTPRRHVMEFRNERQSIGEGDRRLSAASGGTSAGSLPPNAIVLTSLNIDEAEAVLIQRALEAAKGNRTRSAQLLGISVRTLRNKLNGPRRIEVA